jgi:carbon-monoxide dehydrogenase medium subunit
MIPKEFEYTAPTDLAGALAALRDGGEDAKILAGGHSLIPTMKLRLAAPSLLVDLGRIEDLRELLPSDRVGRMHVGAMVTHRQLAEGDGLLAECARSIGDRQVRARGTLGGSIAHADPAADLPAAILALDATLIASRLDGGNGGGGVATREIAAADFFTDLFATALAPGEILTSIRFPVPERRTGGAYIKIRNKASHYALVGAAAVVTLGDDGTCSALAVGVTGAASMPFRATALEEKLRGSRLEDGDIQSALGTLDDLDVDWMSDMHGSEAYRRHLTGVVAARAIAAARGRANE